MAPHHDEDRLVSYHTTAIAIDKDKNSQSAVRWAIENLINTSPNLILIHVRVPKYQYQNSMANESIPEVNRQNLESEMAHLFVPYRGFCARKGVQAKEVILEDADVSKAILEYISTNCVNNIVVGASARNALTRKFKNPDLSSSLMKSAPEFCAVFVISKGKVQTVRSAKRPATNTATPPRQPPPPSAASIGLPLGANRTPFGRRGWRSAGAALPERKSVDRGSNDFMRTPGRERPLSTIKSVSNEQLLMEGFDMSMRSQRASHSRESRDSFSDDIDFSGALTFGSCDITAESLEFSNNSDAPRASISGQSSVEVLSCIRHPNMVLLLGACPEYGCLVYEFMDNGSLDDRIFRRGNTPTIPWKIRFKIAAEIATALLFLHQAKPEPLVHRDLKPANILLDRNYTSKISDVGLSRLVPPSVADTVTQYRMTSTAGTFCYIDPEYQQTGMLGIKSDIYSLGIMLLQLVTARPPMGLTHHVERAIEKGTFADMLDPTITDWPMEDVLSYTKMALKCAELRRRDRPDLGSVILPELDRLRSLGCRESGSMSNSYGSHSCSNESNSRLRPSNTSQEAMKSNPNTGIPRRSTLDEGGRNSNSGAAVNGVERRLVPKKLFEAEEAK